jgi:hypothetical protein
MLDLSTLKIKHWPDEIPLWAVDRGPAPKWLLHVWLVYRTDLQWVDVTFEKPNGAYSEYSCIMYPDGTCEKKGIGHHVAWRLDKKATYLQPCTYPGQLKPLVIGGLQKPEVVQCEMF